MTWEKRARNAIAHGSLTNSKRPSCFTSVYPTHLVQGHDCLVWDSDGKRYVDFICALGANLLGYANRHVNEAVRRQLDRGTLYSLSSVLEVEFAEAFLGHMPFAERIRVLKSGSEGCAAALRVARAATGRQRVLSSGYHGWHDEFTSLTPPAVGVPRPFAEHILPLEDNWHYLPQAAAVIVEPVVTDWSGERVQWLQALRKRCTETGAVLIFDETITGLRFPGLSVAKWSGVHPDLIVMGKALANGLPISVVAGRKDVMESDYFVSSTFAGDTLALAAATKALPLAAEHVGELWEQGGLFKDEFNRIGDGLIWLDGYPTRSRLMARDALTKALFMQEMCLAGVLLGPSFFWCQPHAEYRHFVLDLAAKVISKIKNGGVQLTGEMPQSPFAEKVRERGR